MNRESPHLDASRDGPAASAPVSPRSFIHRVLDAIPPASGAIVMASGIVSIDLDSGGHGILSAITLWFAVAVWLVLAVMLVLRVVHQRDRFDHEARSPAALTGVAGTAILGTRLVKDYETAAMALLLIAGVCWVVLIVPVLRHGKTPTIGVSFVLTAATESLAVLGANLAVSYHAGWLVSVAAAALVLGLAFYVFVAARFDLHQLIIGHGDHWIAGGALAICCSSLPAASPKSAAALGQLPSLQQILSISTLALWCLAMVWLFPLIICETLKPPLRYDTRRWATVFPLGIYAAASIETGQAAASPGSLTSATPGHGSVSPPGCSRSPGCSIRGLLVLRGQPRPSAAQDKAWAVHAPSRYRGRKPSGSDIPQRSPVCSRTPASTIGLVHDHCSPSQARSVACSYTC